MKRQSLKSLDLMESPQLATQKLKFNCCAITLRKTCYSKETSILLNFLNSSTIFFFMIAVSRNVRCLNAQFSKMQCHQNKKWIKIKNVIKTKIDLVKLKGTVMQII